MIALLLKQILAVLTEIRDLMKSPPLPTVPYEQVAAMMDAPPYDPLAGLRKAAQEQAAARGDGPTPPMQTNAPSFSSLQGMVSADDPRSSVDPRYPKMAQAIADGKVQSAADIESRRGEPRDTAFDGPTAGTPYTETVRPPVSFPNALDAQQIVEYGLSGPLPPARPAGSEPDLDTALTMGMEAPAPVVAPDRKGPASLYPIPSLTPGVIFPQITGDDVSVAGYAKRVRAVPEAMKRAVYQRYGLDPAKHEQAEVDHYVSLCLGGTNDIENLWPEPAVTPDAPGQVGFHEKDAVEFWLHQQVCNKSMSLQAAQDAIRGDWYATYLSIPHAHLAMMSAMLDAPEQP